MNQEDHSLRGDALRIWQSAVAAVDSRTLVRRAVRVEGHWLQVGTEHFDLRKVRRILVVGAGKAGAGMTQGLEEALGPDLLAEKQVAGWINVPADCVRPLSAVHLHAARAAGQNEPTAAGVVGAEEILRLVGEAHSADLCIALISGGGSALLPAPAVGITLDDKLAVTKFLSAAGADIRQLNTVRKRLSRIKGGGLRSACRAGHLVTLIISDVIGDPLDIIASGPTVDDPNTSADALAVLETFRAREGGIPPAVFTFLKRQVSAPVVADDRCRVTNLIIGNNAVAVEAAAREAESLGYETSIAPTHAHEGPAEEVGRRLAAECRALLNHGMRRCYLSGGEPTVQLVDAKERGSGGRNQQLVLAAAEQLLADDLDGFALLSGGTDGEDGPTDAAGAIIDHAVLTAMRGNGLNAAEYLRRNDAYHFFGPLAALIKTGPTHTNVCDVRVVVVDPRP